MPDLCDITKQAVDDIKAQNESMDRIEEEEFHSKVHIRTSIMDKLNKKLNDKFGANVVKSHEWKEVVDELYGKKDDRTRLAVEVLAILNAHKNYWKWAKRYILLNLPDRRKIDVTETGIDLSSLPESVLVNMHKKLAAWSHAGNGDWWGKGVIGSITVQIGVPQTVGMKERTAAYYIFSDSSREFPMRVSQRINDFMDAPKGPQFQKSKRNYGWNDITREVERLVAYLPQDEFSFLAKERISTEMNLMRFFIWNMHGDAQNNTIIRWNEDLGDYEIASRHSPTKKRYKKDENKMFVFTDYVPLKDYQGGKFYLPIAKVKGRKGNLKMKEELEKLQKKFRKLDDELFDYQEKEFSKSVKKIVDAYSKVFGLSSDELQYALTGFIPKNVYGEMRTQFKKDVKAKIAKKQETFDLLKDAVTGTAVLNQYWSDVNQEKMKNHYPAVYDKFKLVSELDSQIAGDEGLAQRLDGQISDHISKGEVTEATKKRDELAEVNQRLLRNNDIRDIYDEMTEDFRDDRGEGIPTIQKQVYMKQRTNAIDPRKARADSHSYYTALKRTMSSIERNNLIALMIEQVGRAESFEVQDMIVNNFKVPFGFPDVKSGLGPFDFNTDSIRRKIGGRWFNIPAASVDRKLRMIGAGVSAQLLHGFGTAIQNMTAIQQAAIDYGMRPAFDAITTYFGSESAEWRDFIQRSGVVEFRDFFSKSLTNEIISSEIELDTHQKVMGAILKYYGRKSVLGMMAKFHKEGSKITKKELDKEIEEILLKSKAFNEWHSIIPEEQRALKRRRLYKEKKLQNVISKYVEWAITKEFEFSQVYKEITVMNALPQLVKATAGNAFKFVTNLVGKKTFLTMSAGEELIRTVGFIIGVKKAMEPDSGLLPQVPIGTLKGEDYFRAIEIGKLYSRHSNFGMTPQDVGCMWWSPGGNLVGKFKIWPVQKFSRDIKLLKYGFASLESAGEYLDNIKDAETKKQWMKFRKVFRAWKLMLTTSPSKLRASKPEVAQMRTFIFMQGFVTVLMDVFLFGPLGGNLARFLAYRMGLAKVAGARSDVLGFMLLPLVLGIRGWLDDDEDDDNLQWTMGKLLRNSMLGYVPVKLGEWMWSIMEAAIHQDKEHIEDAVYETFEDIIPFKKFGGREILNRAVKGNWSGF